MPWIWPLADLVHMQITDADINIRSRWLGDCFHSIWLNGVWNQTRKWSAMLIINLICCVTFDIAKSVAADFQWHFSHVATSNEISSFEININDYNSTHSSSCLSEMTRISAIRYLSLSAVVFLGLITLARGQTSPRPITTENRFSSMLNQMYG